MYAVSMRRLLHIINDVPLGWMLAALAATILLFSLGYWAAAGDGARRLTAPILLHTGS